MRLALDNDSARALAATVARAQLPAVARAHEQLALDVAIADQAAVVRAVVVDDDERATLEPRDRDRARAVACGDDAADGHEADLVQLRTAVVGVVAEDVEQLGMKARHPAKLRRGSDTADRRRTRDRSAYWQIPPVQLVPALQTSTPDANIGSVHQVPGATVPFTLSVNVVLFALAL